MTNITETQRAKAKKLADEISALTPFNDRDSPTLEDAECLLRELSEMPVAEPGSDADMVHKLMGSTIAETVRADAAEKSVEDLEAALASWKAMHDMLSDEMCDLDAMHKADVARIAELEALVSSEGTRAVNYLRRARNAEVRLAARDVVLRQALDAFEKLEARDIKWKDYVPDPVDENDSWRPAQHYALVAIASIEAILKEKTNDNKS